jgi:hypothetical protein
MKYLFVILLGLVVGCSSNEDKNKLSSYFNLKDDSQIRNIIRDGKKMEGFKNKEVKTIGVTIQDGTSVKEWSNLAYGNFSSGKIGKIDKGLYTLEYLNLGLNKVKRINVSPGDQFVFRSPEKMGLVLDLNSSFMKCVAEGKIQINSISANKPY